MNHVLWTGGWDSTYRVLELAWVHAQPVQPHYILHRARRSYPLELQAQANLRAGLAALSPDAAARILPTRIVDHADIPPNATIHAQYHAWRAQYPMAEQMEWMACYAAHLGIRLELGQIRHAVHWGPEMARQYGWIAQLTPITVNDLPNYGMEPPYPHAELAFLRWFLFPLKELSKQELGQAATVHGFRHLLDFTWYCHRPLLGRLPCGACTPCRIARAENPTMHRHPLTHAHRWVSPLVHKPLRGLKRWARGRLPRVYGRLRALVRGA